ncbi:putative diguanylate cyclase YegE [mine drainage metagenome]|uniref:Putative diguanylate cyclase YegE n=1 Tax=mine drainage metagenome TaxID=410659 RepID=A0A1J5SB97_9ZZZZ
MFKTVALQKAILNSAHFSIIATDAQGVIQVFNIGAERMLGYTAAEVLNKVTPAAFSDPQEMIARAKSLSIELGTAIAPGFETLVFKSSRCIEDIYALTCIRKDGSHLSAIMSVTALRDAQGLIIGYLLIGTDNTLPMKIEAERQQLALRLSDQQFYTRALFESSVDALVTTDLEGIITDVNRQMEALTGNTRDGLIGAPFKSCFSDTEHAEAGFKQVLNGIKLTDHELAVSGRDGKETVVSLNATTFTDRSGKPTGVFADARNITERKQAEKQILYLAFHDSLTQLPNRRLLDDRLRQAMTVSKRNGRYGALIFLDLDNFKSLNDAQGHHVGDLLLIEVAQRINDCVREVDIVTRFGGDEFVVILGNLDADKATSTAQTMVVANKIRTTLNHPYVLKVRQEGTADKAIVHHCTASIGVALFLDHEVGTEEVIKWADIAMYQAKEAGGDSIRFFDAE